MKRIKKFVALALAATMMVAPASTAFAAKSAQIGDKKPSIGTSTEKYPIQIPMIKENGKWKIDPLYAYIGIKNIKWNSTITDMAYKHKKKVTIDTKSKYAPYALLLKQTGTIVPRTEPLKTPDMTINFWVKGDRQKYLYTRHEVVLNFVTRKSPLAIFSINGKDYSKKFDTSNSYSWLRPRTYHFRTVVVKAAAGNKIKKLVACGKDGHNFVFKSGSKVDLSKLKAIQVRYEVKRDTTNPYYDYLKKDVGVPAAGVLTLNIK